MFRNERKIMKILAIESSCDETAAAVVEDGRNIISSVVASQVEEHKLYGGVVPEIASRRHAEAIVPVVRQALEDADCRLSDIDAIGVTYAPGLIGALLVGVNFAKGLSLATGIPLVPVHHLRSHIASNYISNKELKPPFLCLVVSGGHSHIVMVEDYTKMKIIGKPVMMPQARLLTKPQGQWECRIRAELKWTELRKTAIRLHSSSLVPQFTMRRMISAFRD